MSFVFYCNGFPLSEVLLVDGQQHQVLDVLQLTRSKLMSHLHQVLDDRQ